jgi:hypothetical protein
MAAHVGDDSSEDVESSSRASRIRSSSNADWKRQPLPKWDQIGPILLEHRSLVRQIEFAHAVLAEFGAYLTAPRQEAAPQSVGDIAQGQIQACRLDVSIQNAIGRSNVAISDQCTHFLSGQYTFAVRFLGQHVAYGPAQAVI